MKMAQIIQKSLNCVLHVLLNKASVLLKVLTICCLVAESCPPLCNPMVCSLSGSSVHGIFKNTGVGCHFILQGIFHTKGSNPPLLYWQADSLPPSHQESPTQFKFIPKVSSWLSHMSLTSVLHSQFESRLIRIHMELFEIPFFPRPVLNPEV